MEAVNQKERKKAIILTIVWVSALAILAFGTGAFLNNAAYKDERLVREVNKGLIDDTTNFRNNLSGLLAMLDTYKELHEADMQAFDTLYLAKREFIKSIEKELKNFPEAIEFSNAFVASIDEKYDRLLSQKKELNNKLVEQGAKIKAENSEEKTLGKLMESLTRELDNIANNLFKQKNGILVINKKGYKKIDPNELHNALERIGNACACSKFSN